MNISCKLRGKENNKNAFTLAEVLITLGIIGVVAAMTIPTLINKYNEQATISRVKKVYSTLSQAILMAVNEYGSLDGWFVSGQSDNITNNEIFLERIKPYLKILKNCGNDGNCLFNKEYKTMNDTVWQSFNLAPRNYIRLILSDGTELFYAIHNNICKFPAMNYRGYNNECGYIFIDTNGNKKAPNKFGEDAFSFSLIPNGLALPRAESLDNCSKNGSGWSCSALIIRDGNMNYLKQ